MCSSYDDPELKMYIENNYSLTWIHESVTLFCIREVLKPRQCIYILFTNSLSMHVF